MFQGLPAATSESKRGLLLPGALQTEGEQAITPFDTPSFCRVFSVLTAPVVCISQKEMDFVKCHGAQKNLSWPLCDKTLEILNLLILNPFFSKFVLVVG